MTVQLTVLSFGVTQREIETRLFSFLPVPLKANTLHEAVMVTHGHTLKVDEQRYNNRVPRHVFNVRVVMR